MGVMRELAATVEDKEIIIRINKCKILILEIKEGVVEIEIVLIVANLDTCQKNARIQDNKNLWEEVEEEMMEEEILIGNMMMKRESKTDKTNLTTGEINLQTHLDQEPGVNQKVYLSHLVDGARSMITRILLKIKEDGVIKLQTE